MKRVLMVAEKPSVADAIARAIAPASSASKTSEQGLPVFRFKHIYEKEPAEFVVTSSTGHIYSLDFIPKFNDKTVDETELFDAPVVKKLENEKVFRVIKSLCIELKFDSLILWLDCDREGENICFEVIKIAEASLKPEIFRKLDIKRAHFSSLVASDLRVAFQSHLKLPDENLSKSVDARQELDLRIGVAFTRFLTRYLRDWHGGTISYGPCQMPTLWFCVNRQDEINSFVRQRYHVLRLVLQTNQDSWSGMWKGGRIFHEPTGRLLLSLVAEELAFLEVANVSRSLRKSMRPLPFNTMNLLRAASTALGMSPHRAMAVAEQLYLSGLVTYPRTESTQFAPNFDLRHSVRVLAGGCDISGRLARQLLTAKGDGGEFAPRAGGADAGDHPPVTPCAPAPSVFQSSDHERLFTLIALNFLQSVADNAMYNDTELVLQPVLRSAGAGEPSRALDVFVVKTSVLHTPGYLDYKILGGCDDLSTTDGSNAGGSEICRKQTADALLRYQKGDQIRSEAPSSTGGGGGCGGRGGVVADTAATHSSTRFRFMLEERYTEAPRLLTESELLTLMEKNGIGTDASVTVHIQNVINRGYVQLRLVGSRREMEATELGLNLCRAFARVDHELAKPMVRGIIERSCDSVAQGKVDASQLVSHVLAEFKIKFQYFLRNIGIFEELLQLNAETLERKGSPFSRCGKCRRFMLLVNKTKLVCRTCAFTLTMPPRPIEVKSLGEEGQLCPYDNFEILVALERSGRAFCFCPFCFNYSPDDTAKIQQPQPQQRNDQPRDESSARGQQRRPAARGGKFARRGEAESKKTDDKEDALATTTPQSNPRFGGGFRCTHSWLTRLPGSLYHLALARCCTRADSDCEGWLYIQNFNGCRLSIVCTLCDYLVPFDPLKCNKCLKLHGQLCECGWNKLKATRISDKGTIEGCVGCDQELIDLLGGEVKRKKFFHSNRGGRGGGRGRRHT